ncbi:histone-lysine N-methyltransferase NSD3 isoform X1 [Halyomorpha halys]|uniref:histone-lysine N-methyltransferase NSD3 isoform X1 n=1 Tax=Halyomorpha halys TaxID=286706 RepID=UPI0006D4D42C|nr:histone-lysine N-methyltransferase NSD2 isoform X2 [Halyomorpha halys]
MEEAVLGGPDFNIHKLMINNQDKTEWKKSSPLKTYSKKTTPTNDGKSRYGRSHKPRLSGDFLSTDKKVSQYLRIDVDNQMHYFKASPYAVQKTPMKSPPIGTASKRGRKPKALTLLKQENRLSNNLSDFNVKTSHPVSNINDIEAPVPTSTETLPLPDQLIVPKDEQYSDSEECINDGDWNVGDLAWACVGGFPYWPCAITKDPVELCFKKVKILGKNRQPKECIHVRFFGDRGRRSWIMATHILPFHGLDSFLSLAEETCTAVVKKKDPRLYRSFTVLPSVRKAWQAAVSEAESLMESPRHERVMYFMNLYPSPPPEKELPGEIVKPEPKKRGRKRKSELPAPPIAEKKIKYEPIDETLGLVSATTQAVPPSLEVPPTPATEATIKKEPVTPVKESPRTEGISTPAATPQVQLRTKMETDVVTPVKTVNSRESVTSVEGESTTKPKSEPKSSPPTGKKRGRPPGRRKKSSEDDFDFTPLKRKYIKKSSNDLRLRENRTKKKTFNFDMKKMKKLRDPAYEIFYEKNFDRVSDENPELSEEDIDKFIEKMWKEVKEKQSTFKARSRDGAERGCSDSGRDSNSETSSRSDSPPPLILPSVKTVFKRGISLFSGVKSEKVCQICFKGGDVLKCRGPCNQQYHIACAAKPSDQPLIKEEEIKKEEIVKKKRGRPRKSLPLPLNNTINSPDIKPVENNNEDIKPAINHDNDVNPVLDNGDSVKSPVENGKVEDIKPVIDKNGISTVESIANSCIAELEEQLQKNAPCTKFAIVNGSSNENNSDQNISKVNSFDTSSANKVDDNSELTNMEITNSEATLNDNGDTDLSDKSVKEPDQESLDLNLGIDLNEEESTNQGEEQDMNSSNSNDSKVDVAETNESIEEELRNSEFIPKVDDSLDKSAVESNDEVTVNSVSSCDSLSKDSSDVPKAEAIEIARKDNLKLLGTLRGDSFESESSNNNMLVVDDSSADDRLMIEESPVSETQDSSSDVNNETNVKEKISSANCEEEAEKSSATLLDMPIIDFTDITENDQNEPILITQDNKDNSVPIGSGDSLYSTQAASDSSLPKNASEIEGMIETPPVSSPIDVSDSKAEESEKENIIQEEKGSSQEEKGSSQEEKGSSQEEKGSSQEEKESSSSEEISNKASKPSKKEEKENVRKYSKAGKVKGSGKESKDDGETSAKNSDTDSDKTKNKGWMCSTCTEGKVGPCFICAKDEGDRSRCGYCGKVYHLKCAREWPQSQISETAKGRLVFHCPQHACHTCISDNPSTVCARFTNDRLVRCVKCPSTYHYGNYCIPAGSEILSISQIICPKHYVPHRKGLHHVNASWCFICAIAQPIAGGSLICCDLCPNSFHAECLKISPPEGAFICEDCETGRYPLFGEIVWVKLGTYRWWPAKILYPQEVPENINQLAHTSGEFAVEFFGTHDYYWVNRGRVFLYHEGDGCKVVSKSRVDELFTRGVQEASEAFVKWSEERANREATSRPSMKPPKFVKIQSNRFYGNVNKIIDSKENVATTCDCNPTEADPCGPESDCINRLLMVECNPQVCPAGENCCNQNFEKKNYPNLTPYKTETRGWGLKTLDPIPKGGFIIEYVGEMIDEEEYRKRLATMQQNKDENFYFLTIDKDRMLDAGPKGNVARFMNHSCDPNCETQKWTVNGDTRVGLFALEDIKAGTELVFNYNLETIGNTKVECKCGASNCAGYIGAKNLSKPNNNKPKNGTEDKKSVVKKKKRKSTKANKHTEDSCFTCGNGGELLLCDDATCPKAYHLSCLGLTKHPAGGWVCPWHQCSVCSATKVQRCTLCINSYCSEHAEGNISLSRNHGLLCFSHNLSDSGSDWSAASDDEDSSKVKSASRKYSRSKIVNGHAD